ncbi:MAG: hypothetical protein IKP88_08265 [Lachnospiraceae bacterium]|nr:hypothetical protein [Lachnospiraceae bacterium]
MDLILVHKITYNMEDIVRAEVEKTVKLLIHMKVVNRRFDKAVWNEEIIDKNYVKTNNSLKILFAMIIFINIVTLTANIISGGPWLTSLGLSLVLASCTLTMIGFRAQFGK